jgi:hypothetical protein
MSAVAQQLVEVMSDSSKVMIQRKEDTLDLQIEGLA